MLSVPLPLVALIGGFALWACLMWVGFIRAESKKTDLQIRQEQIDEATRRRYQRSRSEQFRARLVSFGWDDNPSPLLFAVAFTYLLCGAALRIIGVTGIAALFLALPFSLLAVLTVAANLRVRRQRAFTQQLIQALDLFAGQLKAGIGANRAIESVLPALPEPLRGELGRAVSQHRANRPLSDAVHDVAQRYPSSAMRRFVAVLRIDEARGGAMAPALEEASASVRRDAELEAEAVAELAQERGQFVGIVAIILFIAVYMYTGSSDANQEALRSPVGLIVMGVMSVNFAVGVIRALRTFAKVRGGV